MSRCFRCLNIYTTKVEHCYPIRVLLGIDAPPKEDMVPTALKKGFHAFYCHGSIISDYHSEDFDPQAERSASVLKECFQKVGVTAHEVPSPKTEPVFVGKDLFLLAHKAKPPAEFAKEIVLAFGGKLRSTLSSDAPYKNTPGYALYQASILNLLSEAYEQSAIYDTGGIYREYLLWNDNGLWTQDEWTQRAGKLQNTSAIAKQAALSAESSIPTTGEAKLSLDDANLRLAWLGSGWLSSRQEGALEQNPSNYATDPCPYPPEIEAWAKAALERLMTYDTVLLAYYRKEQKADLPGWQDWQNYISTLCEFLPYHKPRSNPDAKREDYLPTNSSGSRGGPRLWQGYLGPQVNMHIRHLLLDGWLTLWPVDGKLYYQPGSLALLYWAAKHADKPYTNSPKDFIENYDWSAAWFGGNWRGQQYGGQ